MARNGKSNGAVENANPEGCNQYKDCSGLWSHPSKEIEDQFREIMDTADPTSSRFNSADENGQDAANEQHGKRTDKNARKWDKTYKQVTVETWQNYTENQSKPTANERQRALLRAMKDTLLDKLTPEVQTVNIAQPGIQLTIPKQPAPVINVAPSPAPNVNVAPTQVTVNCDMADLAGALTQALAPLIEDALTRSTEAMADTIYRGMVELGKAMIEQARILAARPAPVIPEAKVQVAAPQVRLRMPKRELVEFEVRHSDGTTSTVVQRLQGASEDD